MKVKNLRKFHLNMNSQEWYSQKKILRIKPQRSYFCSHGEDSRDGFSRMKYIDNKSRKPSIVQSNSWELYHDSQEWDKWFWFYLSLCTYVILEYDRHTLENGLSIDSCKNVSTYNSRVLKHDSRVYEEQDFWKTSLYVF